MSEIKMLGNQVLVLEAEKEAMKNGLYIPSSSQKFSNQGTVVSVGPGKVLDSGMRYKMSVSVDDVVVFDPNDCREINIEGQDYVILMDEELFGILS